jgi:hypothetical protein
MIVLCATCHGRKKNTHDPRHINRASLQRIKQNLLMLNRREYPSPSSDQINSFVSEIGDFSGTKFDVAGSGKSDRALEYFLNVIEPALSKAGWVHIDWIWDTDGDTFQMLSTSTTTKRHYGVVTGVTYVVVEAAMYGDKNEAADALVSVREHIESDESFVIQERRPDSGGAAADVDDRKPCSL